MAKVRARSATDAEQHFRQKCRVRTGLTGSSDRNSGQAVPGPRFALGLPQMRKHPDKSSAFEKASSSSDNKLPRSTLFRLAFTPKSLLLDPAGPAVSRPRLALGLPQLLHLKPRFLKPEPWFLNSNPWFRNPKPRFLHSQRSFLDPKHGS